jgi:hypothetical protein
MRYIFLKTRKCFFLILRNILRNIFSVRKYFSLFSLVKKFLFQENNSWNKFFFLEIRKRFFAVYNKEMLPPSFNHFFLCVKQVHSYNTRNSNLLFVPFRRTEIRQFSVIYQGVKLFNSLPRDIYGASSISCFRKSLKEYLFTL